MPSLTNGKATDARARQNVAAEPGSGSWDTLAAHDGASMSTQQVYKPGEPITGGAATSDDLVELSRAGLAGGRTSYERVQRAAAEPGYWAAWAARELHWYHAEQGAWLIQTRGGCWSGWRLDGSPGALDAWRPWTATMDTSEEPHVRWFCGGQTNAAFNEVDRQVLRGCGSDVAFIADSPMGEAYPVTRRWLLLEAVLAAHALRDGLHVQAPQRIAMCAAASEGATPGHCMAQNSRLRRARKLHTSFTTQVHAQHARCRGLDRGGEAARRALCGRGGRHCELDAG